MGGESSDLVLINREAAKPLATGADDPEKHEGESAVKLRVMPFPFKMLQWVSLFCLARVSSMPCSINTSFTNMECATALHTVSAVMQRTDGRGQKHRFMYLCIKLVRTRSPREPSQMSGWINYSSNELTAHSGVVKPR